MKKIILAVTAMLMNLSLTIAANAASISEINVSEFSSGLASVCVNGYRVCSYIDKTGAVVIPAQ